MHFQDVETLDTMTITRVNSRKNRSSWNWTKS